MAKNRELSQLGALVVVDDSNRNIGIATTDPPRQSVSELQIRHTNLM